MRKLFNTFIFRKTILAIADALIIIIASVISGAAYNFVVGRPLSLVYGFSMGLCVIFCFCALFAAGMYNRLWRYINASDYVKCVLAVAIGMVVAQVAASYLKRPAPLSYLFIDFVVSSIGVCLFRALFKDAFLVISGYHEQDNGLSEKSGLKRTMIVGGGQACKLLLNEYETAMKEAGSKTPDFIPVCIIDDDQEKLGTSIHDVPIVGCVAQIKFFADKENIERIIFAIPSSYDGTRQRILDACSATNLPVKVMPFICDLMFGSDKTLLKQIRDINVEDLLGRDPITFDSDDVKRLVSSKVCMVTGGGGSIGSEIVRQIAKYKPRQLIIVDIYENNAYDIQQELNMKYGDKLNLVTLIASVRDYDRMNSIFDEYRPNIVFHAAAHKHVPLMEDSPMEAVKNNIIGTMNMASLAQFYSTDRFVMISTDKAVNPTNVMGASKKCCEMVIQYFAQQKGNKTNFVTTRFGNVLGSNGSVIPLFKRQIESGRDVTVTHPDIIRYFMTIPEAVSLVLEAASMSTGGQIFVLDMGKPVRIVTLAENLIRMYGKTPYEDVNIVFTGLRPGEKLKEELLMDEEGLTKTTNHLIFIGKQVEIDETEFVKDLVNLKVAARSNNSEAVVESLHKIVPTFTTPEEFNRNIKVTNITA